MRSNINFLLDIIDENEVADKILSEFFNVKIKSDNLTLKKIQLKSHLSENNTRQVTKKYRNKATTPLDIVLIECAIEKLKNKSKEELLSYFSTKEGIDIPNFYKICTMMYMSSDFVKENLELISTNVKENKALFRGIYNEIIDEDNNSEVVKHIEQLNELIAELRKSIDKLENDNKNLSKENQKLDNEILKLNRESKKNESKIETYIKENENLNKEINDLKLKNKEKEDLNNSLSKEILQLEKELKENTIHIELNDFECDYKLAFIHKDDFNICKKLFNEVLFIKYDEVNKKYSNFVNNLKKYNIDNVIMQTNKISTFNIMKLESNLRKENINMDMKILNDEKSAIEFIVKNLDR